MESTESCPWWVLNLIRASGIFIMFFVALSGAPDSLCADGDCIDYRIGCVVSANVCLSYEGPCGEEAGEECTEEGMPYCEPGTLWSCPGSLPYAIICGFVGGGPPQ